MDDLFVKITKMFPRANFYKIRALLLRYKVNMSKEALLVRLRKKQRKYK